MSYFGIFGLGFEKRIVIFKINLKFFYKQGFVQK